MWHTTFSALPLKVMYLFSFRRFVTRDAFMRNVMNHQEFTHYPYFMELIREVEQLFANIQKMERYHPSTQFKHAIKTSLLSLTLSTFLQFPSTASCLCKTRSACSLRPCAT
jgi:hypothetical protein